MLHGLNLDKSLQQWSNKEGNFNPKSMLSIFSRTTGVIHIDCALKGETISYEYWIENCLKPLVKVLQIDRPKCDITNLKIHHDNARPHVHTNVNNFLTQHGIDTIELPAYSPDMAPCDFRLLSLIESLVVSYTDAGSLKKQITNIDIDRNEYVKTFEKWLERIYHCII